MSESPGTHDYLEREMAEAASQAGRGALRSPGTLSAKSNGQRAQPDKSPEPNLATLVAVLHSEIKRARDVCSTIRDHADTLAGAQPEASVVETEKPSSGTLLGSFSEQLLELNAVINEMVHHNGRVGRALN